MSASSSTMISVADAIARMQASITPITEIEAVPLAALVDRVSAEPIQASTDIPGYTNSAMDGYAYLSSSLPEHGGPVTLKIAGVSQAGHPFQGNLAAGQCIRILTGAQVPSCVDTVIAQEQINLDDANTVTLLEPLAPGSNIRRQGEELSAGQTVYEPGRRFNPVDIGLIASFGYATVKVRRRLKVVLFSTGDELVAPGKALQEGQLYDSNRYALQALLERAGYEVINLGLIPDDYDTIAHTFEKASHLADAIVCSGGVSVGDFDFTKQVLDSYGSVGFWKVAMKPGKPFAFGKVNTAYFFGLPGNPVSALVTFDQLALPALATLQGEFWKPRQRLYLKTGEALKKRPGRADFQRGWLRQQDGETKVFSTGPQGSAMLTSVAQADVFVRLAAAQGRVEKGEWVEVEIIGAPLR